MASVVATLGRGELVGVGSAAHVAAAHSSHSSGAATHSPSHH